MKSPLLINAAEMERQHPKTFHRPSDRDLQAIDAGSSVKVCHEAERFWVSVTRRKGDVITGAVNNYLVISPLQFGETIRFHVDNIFDVQIEDEKAGMTP